MIKRPSLTFVAGIVVIIGAVVVGIGAHPRYIEELRIGGGYGDAADGGADFEKDGDIFTDGDVTATTFNGIDLSSFPQTNIDDSDEGQEFPGTDHTADQATTIEEELDAIRHMLYDISGETNWYDEIPESLSAVEDSVSNTTTGHDHDGVNSRAISLIPGSLSINGDVELGDSDTDKVKLHGVAEDLGSGTASRLFRHANPQNLIEGGNFEAWPSGVSNNPASWILGGGGSVAKETSIVKFGSASAELTGATSDVIKLSSTSEPSAAEARGRTFTFGGWIYTSDPSEVSITAQISSSSWPGKAASETDTWHLVTMTFTIPEDSTAFNCYLKIAPTDPPVVAYFDGASLVEGPEDWSFTERPIVDHGDQTIYGGTTTLEEDVDGVGHDLVVTGQITTGTSDVTITSTSGYVTSGGIADIDRTINIPIPAWNNPDDNLTIGAIPTFTDGDNPTYSGSYLFFDDEGENNDWASTTVVIPEDYVSGDGEDTTLLVYALPETSVANLKLECELLVQTAGSGLSTTTYTPTAATFGTLNQIKKCEFDIDAVASVSAGKILVIRIRRGELGACTGTIKVVGTALQYKAAQ